MQTVAPYIPWIILFIAAIPPTFTFVPANPIIGFRFASATADPVVWRRSNKFFGRTLLIGSLMGVLFTHFFPTFATDWGGLIALGVLLTAVLVSFAYMKAITRTG